MKVSLPTALQLYWSIQREINRLNDEVNEIEKKGKNVSDGMHIMVNLCIAQSLKNIIDGVEG